MPKSRTLPSSRSPWRHWTDRQLWIALWKGCGLTVGDLDATTLWTRVLEALSGKIAPRTIDTLLRPLEPLDATADRLGGVFVLKAPNVFSRDWVARHYGPLIEEG